LPVAQPYESVKDSVRGSVDACVTWIIMAHLRGL